MRTWQHVDIFRTVMASPDRHGILVNGATSEHSVPVSRAHIAELMG
jgi:hypothetical protein